MISKPTNRGKSPKLITDDWRWQALVRKDERADGLFWYSVKTTGVYCRPSCPARLPNREMSPFTNRYRTPKRQVSELASVVAPRVPGSPASTPRRLPPHVG